MASKTYRMPKSEGDTEISSTPNGEEVRVSFKGGVYKTSNAREQRVLDALVADPGHPLEAEEDKDA